MVSKADKQMKRHEQKHRLNLELGPRSYQSLVALQEAMEASSQAETIRLALQTLAKLAAESQAGARVRIHRQNGEVVEVLLPLSSA